MPIMHGAESLLALCEHGPNTDPRHKHVISGGGILNSAGSTLTTAGFMIPTVTSGYFYSGETISTNYFANGVRVVVPKAGCRPRTQKVNGSYIWHSGTAGTAYINRFIDGEVWVAGSPYSRSGAQISHRTTGTTRPRGIRYLFVQVVGGGGGGSYRGLGAGTRGAGGSSAIGVCMIKLPLEGYATLVVGGTGAGSGGLMGDGNPGGDSKITCGNFHLTAGGGKAGKYAVLGGSGGAAGTIATSGDNGDGRIIISSDGNAGSRDAPGYSAGVGYTDWAPEGGTSNWVSAMGGYGGNNAYDAGSPGVIGDVIISY